MILRFLPRLSWQIKATGEYGDNPAINRPLDAWSFVTEVMKSPEKAWQGSGVLTFFASKLMQVLRISSLEAIGCYVHVVPSNTIGWCKGGFIQCNPWEQTPSRGYVVGTERTPLPCHTFFGDSFISKTNHPASSGFLLTEWHHIHSALLISYCASRKKLYPITRNMSCCIAVTRGALLW